MLESVVVWLGYWRALLVGPRPLCHLVGAKSAGVLIGRGPSSKAHIYIVISVCGAKNFHRYCGKITPRANVREGGERRGGMPGDT